MTHNPWRYACPHGHRVVERRQNGAGGTMKAIDHHWYCRTCRERYETVTDLLKGREVKP